MIDIEVLTGAALGTPVYRLNCAAIPRIAPHHSARFAMRFPFPQLPAPPNTTIAKVTRQLVEGGPIASATVKLKPEASTP